MLSPSWYSYNTIPASKAQGTSKGEEKLRKSEDQETCCKIVTSTYGREVAPMKSQQRSCPNKICTISTTIDIAIRMKKSHVPPLLDEKLQDVNSC